MSKGTHTQGVVTRWTSVVEETGLRFKGGLSKDGVKKLFHAKETACMGIVGQKRTRMHGTTWGPRATKEREGDGTKLRLQLAGRWPGGAIQFWGLCTRHFNT